MIWQKFPQNWKCKYAMYIIRDVDLVGLERISYCLILKDIYIYIYIYIQYF